MDKLTQYQECIQELLTRYANEDKNISGIDVQLILMLSGGIING